MRSQVQILPPLLERGFGVQASGGMQEGQIPEKVMNNEYD